MKRKLLLDVLLFVAVTMLLSAGPLYGQPGAGANPCPGGPPCNPDVPITGLEYLIGGGALFGIRTLMKRMKKKGD